MFEVLTCGLTPYYWMSDVRLVEQRRRVECGTAFRPVGVPMYVPGLGDVSVLTAAAVDDVEVPWHVVAGPGEGLRGLIQLMECCLDSDPERRPVLDDVASSLQQDSDSESV